MYVEGDFSLIVAYSCSWQVILGARSEVILVAYWTANSSVTWSSLWVK